MDKEWLDYQINVLGKTKAQVARECGVSSQPIYYWWDEVRRQNIKEERRKHQKEYHKNHKKEAKESKRRIKMEAFNILGGL